MEYYLMSLLLICAVWASLGIAAIVLLNVAKKLVGYAAYRVALRKKVE